MRRELLIITALALGTALRASAQQSMLDQEIDNRDGTRVAVRAVFDPQPPSGCAPVRVVATNGSARELSWTFDFTSATTAYRRNNTHQSSFGLKTMARSTGSAVFLVPLAVGYGDSSGYRYNQHNFRVNVSTDAHEDRSGGSYNARVVGFPAIAISKSLADANLTKLNDEAKRRSSSSSGRTASEVFASSFNPDDLPEDWLGFSGFDYVMITALDWDAMRPGVRLALTQWVRFGGKLHVYVSSSTVQLSGLPSEPPGVTGAKSRMSLGQVLQYSWNGSTLPAADTVSRYAGGTRREEILMEGYTGKAGAWGLIHDLGKRSFASWQVLAFLLVFGILVGPVNLFLLAPPGKRHKLFFTTPLLSVGASVLMIVLILFQDGTGGIGRRMITLNIEPAETTAYVTQEQISRTGVLLSSGFEMPQPALIEPLALPDSAWAKLKSDVQSQPTSLSQRGKLRSGNFFQSRTEQAQSIRTAVSTRARLELKAGTAADAPPVLISALGFTVSDLFYIDAEGKVWRSNAPLVTGQASALEATTDVALRATWETASADAGNALRKALQADPAQRKGCFIATAKQAPGFTQETLPSIRWTDDQIIVFGTVAKP